MTVEQFRVSISEQAPPKGTSAALAALWWDAKGDWARAHSLVDELETADAMSVHAYLHRKEGSVANAEYWYHRAGRVPHQDSLADEWAALTEALL